MQTVRFALLGCGQIASKHGAALSRLVPGAELKAVCDSNFARAEALAATHRCRAFNDFDQMMAEIGHEIDVVNVLTPTGYHLDGVLRVAAHRKHVVLEKPMALTEHEGLQMLQACEAAGVQLFVVKQNRFNAAVQKLHRAVRAGRFGKIVVATVRVRWTRDQGYYNKDAWRGTRAFDGGVLANQASHHIDLLQWLVGDVHTVSAYTARRLVEVETEDTAVAILRFGCGALGVVEATTATRPKDLEASISILGEGGAVEISGFATDEMRTWQFKPALPEDEGVLAEFATKPAGQDRAYAHAQYLRNVVASVRHEAAEIVDGYEGLKTVRLIEALYKASEQGAEIAIPRAAPNRAVVGPLSGAGIRAVYPAPAGQLYAAK
ncbi:MAG: Gfo/Idh/MocA family oxidoreductase [Alphaproteobacteria bacterium]|nr:Gfo/Idh/MocA family oxidoreductase [Alphaproteobacteria bacterium]